MENFHYFHVRQNHHLILFSTKRERNVNKLPLSAYESKVMGRGLGEEKKYNFCLSFEHKLMFFQSLFLSPPPPHIINFLCVQHVFGLMVVSCRGLKEMIAVEK